MQLPSTFLLMTCLLLSAIPVASSFAPQSQLHNHRSLSTTGRSESSSPPLPLDAIVTTTARRRSSLRAVADPPMRPPSDHQDDKRKKKKDNNNDKRENDDEIGNGGGEEWTPMNGGFLPNFLRRRQKTTMATTTSITTTEDKQPSDLTKEKSQSKQKKTTPIPNVTMIDNIIDYKNIVVDEEKFIVVVRFFASWCRSCKASEPLFRKMVSRYSSSLEGGTDGGNGKRPVKFVMVQLTKDTAYLQEGLGVPSIPYVHVYHPEGGLVEESKFSKGYYGDFTPVLESYIAGSCDLPLEVDLGDDDDDVVGVFE